MTRRTWEVAADLRTEVGEGPAWDDRLGVLWFVDITPGDLYRLDSHTGGVLRQAVGLRAGAVIPSRGEDLVLALEDGVHRFRWGQVTTTPLVWVEADDSSVRMNDAKCDPRGRLFAGTLAYDFAPGRSTLYRFTPGGPVPVITGCAIANGLGWSPDARTMYFIDTPTSRIDRLDYDVTTGEADGRRPWVRFQEGEGLPDGLTVDAEGCVWVAMWGGSSVRRYSPAGLLLEVIDLPVTQVTSVCFGGRSLTDLFVTTASLGLGASQLSAQPLAGSVFVVATDCVGTPTVRVDVETLVALP